MRRLIVNADDCGLTKGINRAIVEGCERGILTSSTLIANSGAFDDAVSHTRRLRQSRPQFSTGCHVVLMDGVPLLDPGQVASLLDPNSRNPAGQFRASIGSFARAALANKLSAEEIEAEAAAQFDRLQNAGVHISHFDCHKHAHMFPSVAKPLFRAAQKQGIAAVRNPFGVLLPVPLGRFITTPKLWRRTTELAVLRGFSSRFQREVSEYGLRTPDGTVGVVATGSLDCSSFAQIIDSLPDGTWEFVCHPGYNDADLDKVRTRLRASREQELALLTSEEIKALLEEQGIELISYQAL